jgi:hypothetical protein
MSKISLDWDSIFQSLVGAIFLGTPNHGTGHTMSTHLLLATIAADPNLQVEGQVLEVLKYGNDVLVDTVNEFVSIARNHLIMISCFFEQKSTNIDKLIGNEVIQARSYGICVIHLLTNRRNGLLTRPLVVSMDTPNVDLHEITSG